MQKDIVRKLKQEIDKIKLKSHRAQPSNDVVVELKKEDDTRTFFVFADERKNYSGVKLAKGKRYRFRLEKYTQQWFDAGIDAHPIHGWGDNANTLMRRLIRFTGRLFSSSLNDDLMVLQGVVEGTENKENNQFSFAKDTENVKESTNEGTIIGEFTSPSTGELYVFANDAQLDYFYRNNCGYLIVTVGTVT